MKVLSLIFLTCTAISAAPSDVLQGFALSNNQFTADVYKVIKENIKRNFVVCPLSAEVVLALIHAGAEGETATELSSTLRLPQKRDAIDQIYHELHPKLQVIGKYTLQSANKIYVNKGYTVQDDYKKTVENVYGASIENIEFKEKSQAASTINKWVNTNTHGKIDKLVTEQDFSEETRAVLLNAIYFKGKWAQAFKKSATHKKHFYLTKKSYVDVDMMEQTSDFRYFGGPNAQFIELPYEGDDITMTIVLPHDKEGLAALEENVHEIVVEPDYRWQKVHLRLPKNKITTFIDLTQVLQKLGIQKAFTQEADFKRMLTTTEEPLFISKVIQKALIETDEEGTVAVAVTGGFMITTLSLPMPPPKPVNFYANHPFIFFLKHKDAGIFFIGRYSTPDGEIVSLEHPAKESDEDIHL